MFEPWIITVKPTEEESRYEVAIQSRPGEEEWAREVARALVQALQETEF
jgi:hypothetical protein